MPRKCPNCDKTLTRTQRQPWMRRIPGSKYYACRGCSGGYLLIFDRWLFKWERLPQKVSSSKES